MAKHLREANGASREDLTHLLARVAKEWLTFERLRQELRNMGASDPLVVSATGRDVETVVLALLSPERPAEDAERTRIALIRSLSGHPDIARHYIQDDVGDRNGSPSAMQAMLRARDDVFARWGPFMEGMQRVGPIMCQICIDGQFQGSGFLVSDRHVLTAHHCIEPLVNADGSPLSDVNKRRRLTAVFDDIVVPGRPTGPFRSTFYAAEDWLVFNSKRDDLEASSVVPLDELQPDRLDFAVICLDEPAGRRAPSQQRGARRNWMDIQDLANRPSPDTQMLIAHFPGGADLRFSVGLFNAHAAGDLRIRYLTPTLVGSSGAPCFTVDWKPYAIHNAAYPRVHVNQGVPLSLIVKAIGGIASLKQAQVVESGLLPVATATGDPIIGRRDIAEHVDAVLRGQSAEVAIVVTSAEQGGKTYTGELIRSMVIDRGHVAFLLDAEKFAADAPEAFARRLVDEIAGNITEDPQPQSPNNRQRARWISHSLSAWTRSQIERKGSRADPTIPKTTQTLWVILDRCNRVKLTPETHELLVALIAGEKSGADVRLCFLLLGYEGDLGAVPMERVWKTRLDLISVAGVLPFMRYVLTSLSVTEDLEVTQNSASSWVQGVTDVGIKDIPKLVQGLKGWAEQRRKKTRGG